MKERPKIHRTDSGRAVKSSQAPHNQLFNCDPTWDGKQSSGKKQDHSAIGGLKSFGRFCIFRATFAFLRANFGS